MSGPLYGIGPWQLALGLVFVLAAGLASLAHQLRLGRELAVGTVRTFAQLFLMGYVLRLVFDADMLILSLGVFLVMVATATHIVSGRARQPKVGVRLPVFATMLTSYFLVALLVTSVIVGAKPWWRPEYFIPLSGMVVGNSMTALSLALERLFADLRAKRAEVEMRLCLGADYREASQPIVRDALRAGMIPSINSMMGVGLVFIPGMMTGQILAGADPLAAIRYQIVVMLMLVGSTALGSLLVVLWARRRCFGEAQRPLV
ncbi:ABC transporter permease [Desulfohalovibrio reitneri]|uniref:ABC transporter permease n=1 Tax=Desulfohalovibrio reitneri TaxID=1307759 RepID=UPI0004A6C067|nr:iron export ABC transporter permease subunit FetB [Desulfohalovibrio reitneri]